MDRASDMIKQLCVCILSTRLSAVRGVWGEKRGREGKDVRRRGKEDGGGERGVGWGCEQYKTPKSRFAKPPKPKTQF